MKLLKRLGAALLTLTMMLAICISAFAAENTGTLTIKDINGNTKASSEYSAYSIITWDASVDADGMPVYTNMKLNAAYKAVIVAYLGLNPVAPATEVSDSEVLNAMAEMSAEGTAELAIKLDDGKPGKADFTAVEGVFSNLPYGYYLVIETANNANDGTIASKPILVGIPDSQTAGNADVVVTVKTDSAGIEKKIVQGEGDAETLVDSNTAAIGDIIRYRSTATIPAYASNVTGISYYMTDTFSGGLTYKGITSVKVMNGIEVVETLSEGNSGYTLDITGAEDGPFTLKLTVTTGDDKLKDWGSAGYSIVVDYTAELNSRAVAGNSGNPNSINLTYSVHSGNTSIYTTPDDTVITYTTNLTLTKTNGKAGDERRLLPGATFELHRLKAGVDPTNINNLTDNDWELVDTQTTGDRAGEITFGVANFTKIEQGTYKLKETVAPTGYNLLTEPIIFTVTANGLPETVNDGSETITWSTDNGLITVGETGILGIEIVNTAGFILPGTGGAGTVLFTMGGIVLIALAGTIFFIYRKKNSTCAK